MTLPALLFRKSDRFSLSVGTTLGLVTAIGAVVGPASSSMADGVQLQIGQARYYEADGETETSLAAAHYAVLDAYADFSAAADGHARADAQLLGMYDFNAAVEGISSFHHSDLASSTGGTWKASSSFDISGVANSRIDSFLTIGGGVGASAPTNTTVLQGDDPNAAGFIYEEDISWKDSLPMAMQGAVDGSHRVFVGRFVLDGEELRQCARLELSGQVEYTYAAGAPVFTEDVAFTYQIFGCESQECEGDLNGDDSVDGADLAAVLGSWGGSDEAADLNGDGAVDGADLAMVLGLWGPCS